MSENLEIRPIGAFEEQPGVVSSGRILKLFAGFVGIGIGVAGVAGWFFAGKDPSTLVPLAGLFLGTALGTQIAQNITGH